MLQPCDAPSVEVADVARAIGVQIVGQLPGGEGAGAYEVRMPDGQRAVLKVDAGDVLDLGIATTLIEALRARGYPAPASLGTGTVADTAYELAELMPGGPVEQIAAGHVPQVVALNELQRDVGLTGRGPWITEIVTSLLVGCVGYCQLGPLRAHDPALLARLQEIADRSRDLAVPNHDVVHFDFSPYNILADGDHVTAVVDWQGATSGDAAFDLITLAYYTYDFALRDQLLDAAAARTTPEALHLYAAHMMLRAVDWSLRHHDDTAVWWATGMGEALLDALGA